MKFDKYLRLCYNKSMKEKPVLEEHYGKRVWVNPKLEKLRKTECLCYNCSRFSYSPRENCRISNKLFALAKKEHLAMIVTRCPIFKEKIPHSN